ncbi:hypothetical protein ACHAXS_006140 [Conticribra weissflogii]
MQIRELILQSDWFSSGNLLLLKNETPYSQDPFGGESLGDTEKITLQNSVRLALVLVREFQNYCCDDSNDGGWGFESICLDDLFVTLSDPIDGNFKQNEARNSSTKSNFSLNENASNALKMGEPRLMMPLQEKQDDVIDLSAEFFSSLNDKGNDVYEQFFAKTAGVAREKPKKGVVNQSKDVDGIELGMGYFSVISNSSSQEERQYNHMLSDANVQTLSKEKPTSNKALLGLEIIHPQHIETTEQIFNPDLNMTKAIQILGCLIYSVFSKGSDPPSHFLPTHHAFQIPTDSNQKSNFFDNVQGRKTKSPRPIESTILSQLLDTNAYTVPICHLLSDMIDIGPTGNALHPFKSLYEIIQDLEVMMSQPHLFVHDDPNNIAGLIPRPPVFGRQYYGRSKELTQLLEIPTRVEAMEAFSSFQQQQRKCVESVFVSGRAGSGKSHLLNRCGDFLAIQGWIVVFADLKDSGNERDAENSLRVRKSLTESLDSTSLCSLAGYLPNLSALIEDISIKRSSYVEANLSHWKLVFLLSHFLKAVLDNERPIMLILDDLQWADSLALDIVLGELLESVGDRTNAHRFLFAGLYRNSEVADDHPLFVQLSRLRQSKSVNVSEIRLSAFSKVDMSDMIAAELRLPTRVVDELGTVVQKKTSGHILFAVELLNAMVRNKTIGFSLKTRRYGWSRDKICSLKTEDSVASFIISTLSTLKPEILHILRILSCFGFHTDLAILEQLDASYFGLRYDIRTSLRNLVAIGVIDLAGGLISFTHDLIHQHVYEDFNMKQRQKLHYKIGLFLGAKSFANSSKTHGHSQMEFLEAGVNQIYLSESKSPGGPVIMERSLLSIAIDHINSVGPEFIADITKKHIFASWNLEVGTEFTAQSNFGCALHYYASGIRFIGKGVWLGESFANGEKICLGLYEGAAAASAAMTSAWIILIAFMESRGMHKEIVEKGISLFRRLNINLSNAPPKPIEIKESLDATIRMASYYTSDEIVNACKDPTDQFKRNLFKLYNTFTVAAYSLASPYLLSLTFEMVQYSMRNNFFAAETAVAFAGFGLFNIFIQQNYNNGKYWADVALKIVTSRAQSVTVRVKWIVYRQIMIWFLPLKQSIKELFSTYQLGMKLGDFSNSMYPLGLSTRFAVFEGENLSLLFRSCSDNLKKMIKDNLTCAKLAILDKVMIDELRGEKSNAFATYFQGSFMNDDDLISHALAANNMNLLEYIYLRRFFLAFWADDWDDAETYSRTALSLPSANRPKLLSIYFTFFRGLISFRQYRKEQSNEKLKNGIEAICKIEFWFQLAPSNFENKLLLLNAEQIASLSNIEDPKKHYLASITAARDNGRVHEQGLAYELMGNFLFSVANEPAEARKCWKNAHTCYLQWGALRKAANLCRKHRLDDFSDLDEGPNSLKHARSGF